MKGKDTAENSKENYKQSLLDNPTSNTKSNDPPSKMYMVLAIAGGIINGITYFI